MSQAGGTGHSRTCGRVRPGSADATEVGNTLRTGVRRLWGPARHEICGVALDVSVSLTWAGLEAGRYIFGSGNGSHGSPSPPVPINPKWRGMGWRYHDPDPSPPCRYRQWGTDMEMKGQSPTAGSAEGVCTAIAPCSHARKGSSLVVSEAPGSCLHMGRGHIRRYYVATPWTPKIIMGRTNVEMTALV